MELILFITLLIVNYIYAVKDMEITTNTTFIVPLFMFTLTTFTFICNESKIFIPLRLTNLNLEFRIEGYI